MSAPDLTASSSMDVNSWQRTASWATHPSQRVAPLLGPGDLLIEIAAGIGAVTVPDELLAAPAVSLTRELVLSTPAYDVWVMTWPTGATSDLHTHDQFVAFHVVSGSLVEERTDAGSSAVRKVRGAGSTTLVPPNTPHSLVSSARTTTVHVHARTLS